MATFKALNIESDDEEDIEIDNTKEIQIEEALKLYQDALKLHAEGPSSYAQAAAAYHALFDSEIFKYPESQSELKRLDLYGPAQDQDDLLQEDEGAPVVGYTVATEENALGTLPQLIHLAQKNYGQFLLESLQHQIVHGTDADVSAHQIEQASVAALNSFVESLDKDDTDADLWRRTAAVGDLLGSRRIARYCLEAVLDADDAGIQAVLSIPGIAESLAGQQLRQLVFNLQDQLSTLQAPLSHIKKRKLSKLLRGRLSTYDAVKAHQKIHALPDHVRGPLRSILQPPTTWADFGDHILRHAVSEVQGTGTNMPGLGIAFHLSVAPPQPDNDAMVLDEPSEPVLPIDTALPEPIVEHVYNRPFEQFVDMDQGRPTAPVPAFSMENLSSESISSSINLPTRKRSTDAAGFHDSTDPGRSRSKRVRARESNVDQSILEDEPMVDTTQAGYQLADLDFVDGLMTETVDTILKKLNLPTTQLRTVDRKALRATSTKPESEILACLPVGPTQRPSLDLFLFFDTYSDHLARMLLVANTDLDSTSDAHVQPSGLSSGPSGQSKQTWPELDESDGIKDFMQSVNQQWLHINQVVLMWLCQFIRPSPSFLNSASSNDKTSYASQKWQEPFKTIVVRVIVTLDDYIFRSLEAKLENHDLELLQGHRDAIATHDYRDALADVDMIQTLFELHLDIFSLIKEPNSGVDKETVVTQGDRTDRWANLARDAMNLRSTILDLPSLKDELNLRYLWAATHHINISADISREHTISCWQELRSIFVAVGNPVIELQNNAVMPHLSVESIDRELSRLTTQDFFVKIFDDEQEDFTIIVESLEPLLEMLHAEDGHHALETVSTSETGSSTLDEEGSADRGQTSALDYSAIASPELVNFLRNSNTQLRLSLWQRLREAYEKIDYQPMVVSCYFRIIEMLTTELRSSAFAEKALVERQTILLKYLRLFHDLLNRILLGVDKHDDALECMDMERIKSGLGALVDIVRLLHSYTLLHDDIRVGLRSVPVSASGAAVRSFSAVTKVLQETQVHAWMITYKLIGEAIPQTDSKLESPDNCLFDFLRSVHNVLGARSICGKFKGVFLKLLKHEYLRMRTDQSVSSEYFDIEFAQVLYDLYGLKLFLNPGYDQQEHHCQFDTSADKHSAMQAVDLLLTLASKMKMNDLLKHPIRDTIEKVHALVTRKKPSDAIIKNREVIRTFLKSPINPSDIFQCVHGVGNLTLHPVPPEHAILAAKGWYFLMGYIHLSRFRSQKRTAPSATDDLDIAVALFMQELEYSMDNWETWFRIAQAYDSKIEEHVSWSAEKLSSNAAEIVQLQKAAIHCYRMAVALAMRSAEPGPDTTAKLGELFADFAMRIYASTREPFDMQAFALGDVSRFFSTDTLIKGIPFRPMQPYVAWKIARGFFKKAINLNPNKWILYYHLSKCTWKMFCRDNESREIDKILIPENVTGEIIRAIELLPTKKDPRRAPAEPILEPHYKLVSVVHKMVTMEELEPDEACNILLATPYAAKVDPVVERSAWEGYILKVVKNLRTADKSHWHHRMIARAANIVYHDGVDETSILAAKHELTQQMFTKTMQLQIWKPENQRPGRHFVYSARYIKFFTRLLDQLNDRAGLDALARRVRKRQADVFEHGTVWQDICQSYLKVLREYGKVPPGHETAIFSGINHEDFLRRRDLLEHWCQDPSSSSPTLDALQEALELKKVNAGLMKAGAIDDLVGDAYAYLYDTAGRSIWTTVEREEAEEKSRKDAAEAEAKAKEQATQPPTPAAAPMPSPARNPMMNLSHLMNVDGASDATTPPPSQLPSAMPTPTGDAAFALADGQAAPQQPRRKIGVGRREIRLCAEACVSKNANGPTLGTSSTALSILQPDPTKEVQVVIESRPRPKIKAESGGETGDHTPAGGASDADDESDSELSDVDEELVTQGTPGKSKPPKLMFPGLAQSPESNLVSSDIEDEGKDDDDGEEEGVGGDEEEGEEEDDGDEEDEEEEGQDVAMGDAGDEDEEEDDDDDDGSELQATSAAWHNQQARLANAQVAAEIAASRGIDDDGEDTT